MILYFGELLFSYFKAQFDAHEMITQRESVSHRVSLELAERAKTFGMMLDDISIVILRIIFC